MATIGQEPEALKVIENVSHEAGTDLCAADISQAEVLEADFTGQRFLYKGEEYACDENQMTSKAVLPRFYGLKTEKSALGTCLLRFGELNGAQSYMNESVTIIWPNGSSDQISFNRDFRWKANGDLEIKEKWFLNSSEVSGKLVKIIK